MNYAIFGNEMQIKKNILTEKSRNGAALDG